MGSQLISGQWSLNETSDSVYSITRGVLEAATSDNVQPLAIMACEQFGNTLAISRETLLKIERTVLPTPEPVTIRFIKAKVGFMKHDCATQLGSNQAGLRFLALTAALISSVSEYHCADALMSMLESTTSDRRLLPTRRHLVDSMSSLEIRCRLSGFTEIIYGYTFMIRGLCSDYPLRSGIPDSEGLAALVDAYRHLQRVGDHEISSIVVEAGECAAWVAAFSKWSLELPPSIYLADGTSVISQPGSQFTIIVSAEMDEAEADLKVTTIFKLNSIQDLVVQSSSNNSGTFCVPLKVCGDIIQEHFGDLKDATLVALPLAITLLLRSEGPELSTLDGPQQFTITWPKAFPSKNVIFGIMSRVFNLSPDFPFNSLASANSFRDLSEVESHFKAATTIKWKPIFEWDPTFPAAIAPWWVKDPSELACDQFRNNVLALSRHLVLACHYLLLLSLFDNTEDLYIVPPNRPDNIIFDNLNRDMYTTLIQGQNFAPPDYEAIWRGLYKLLPYPKPYEELNLGRGDLIDLLVSSTTTHVFWYSILDDLVPKRTDYLRITCRRGRLMYEREVYHEIRQGSPFEVKGTVQRLKKPLDSATQNFYPDLKTQWRLTTQSGALYADLILTTHRKSREIYVSLNPFLAIQMLQRTLLVNCKHPMDSSIRGRKPSWELHSPDDDSDSPSQCLGIFPVGGVGELQMCCLESIIRGRSENMHKSPVVIRKRACFDCCIKVCKENNSRFLIL
ncbi:hypothetical protein GGR58DRAFT_490641 [Xylaria digitata]|nr:hypothetical protein GGR58DRAFT_490641 [Xylaria digitata]